MANVKAFRGERVDFPPPLDSSYADSDDGTFSSVATYDGSDVVAYQSAAGYAPTAAQSAICVAVGVARSRKDRATGPSIPENAALGCIVTEKRRPASSLGIRPLKRKNESTQVFRQSAISKRHRPVSDVVELEADDGDGTRRFVGISRDAAPKEASFISVVKRGLVSVRRPFPHEDGDEDMAPGATVFFHQSGVDNGRNYGTLKVAQPNQTADVVGTVVSYKKRHDPQILLHPISFNGLKSFLNFLQTFKVGPDEAVSPNLLFGGLVEDSA